VHRDTAWPRLIMDDDRVVGFVMGNFDPGNEVAAFRAGIWRLNIAASEQGRGYGRFAVDAIAHEARRRGQSRITVFWGRARVVLRPSTYASASARRAEGRTARSWTNSRSGCRARLGRRGVLRRGGSPHVRTDGPRGPWPGQRHLPVCGSPRLSGGVGVGLDAVIRISGASPRGVSCLDSTIPTPCGRLLAVAAGSFR
jgi:GNAT superfamily N-acetyltransferase